MRRTKGFYTRKNVARWMHAVDAQAKEVAQEIGVDATRFSNFMHGDLYITVPQLLKLSALTGLTLEEVLYEQPQLPLEKLGSNIWHDPNGTIVPDEIVTVFTFEVTGVAASSGFEPDVLRRAGKALASIAGRALPDYNVQCVREQQFVTKSHDEE